jgi:hypothetical protein
MPSRPASCKLITLLVSNGMLLYNLLENIGFSECETELEDKCPQLTAK